MLHSLTVIGIPENSVRELVQGGMKTTNLLANNQNNRELL